MMPSFHWPAENNFMCEQRIPFLGFGEISGVSAYEFVFPVRPFDQPSILFFLVFFYSAH
jgi:hypothetical protein